LSSFVHNWFPCLWLCSESLDCSTEINYSQKVLFQWNSITSPCAWSQSLKLGQICILTIFLQSWCLEPENQRKTSQIVGIITSNGHMDSPLVAWTVEASTSKFAGETIRITSRPSNFNLSIVVSIQKNTKNKAYQPNDSLQLIKMDEKRSS
jgi:hypothetical protein